MNTKKLIYYLVAFLPFLLFLLIWFRVFDVDIFSFFALIFGIFPPLLVVGIIFLILAIREPWQHKTDVSNSVSGPFKKRQVPSTIVFLTFFLGAVLILWLMIPYFRIIFDY